MDAAHLRVTYRHVCSPFLIIVYRALDGITTQEPPPYRFVQDWTNELQELITRPGKFISRNIAPIVDADSRTSDCCLPKSETAQLAVKSYTRNFVRLEFIVQQVLNEITSHLQLFGDLPKVQEILVMVSLTMSYYHRPCRLLLTDGQLHRSS